MPLNDKLVKIGRVIQEGVGRALDVLSPPRRPYPTPVLVPVVANPRRPIRRRVRY